MKNKATWFKPSEDLFIVQRRRKELELDDPNKRFKVSFGLEYRFNIPQNVSGTEGQKLYNLEVQRARYEMEQELMEFIIEQLAEHHTEKLHGFIMVDTPHIPEGKPVLLVHPADRQKLLSQINSFAFRFDYPKPLKEALE